MPWTEITADLRYGWTSRRACTISSCWLMLRSSIGLRRTKTLPEPTGSDKTSIIAELPDDTAGRLLEMLEQFATRGVNMSLLESRPIGDALGRYRFVIDLDGHIRDERVADALLGLKRFSPNVIFLGSYPRADKQSITVIERYDNNAFVEARDWLRALLSGAPE